MYEVMIRALIDLGIEHGDVLNDFNMKECDGSL